MSNNKLFILIIYFLNYIKIFLTTSNLNICIQKFVLTKGKWDKQRLSLILQSEQKELLMI